MKRVRITLWTDDVVDHPVADLITGGADYLSDVAVVNWNVTPGAVGYLLRASGDRERLDAALASLDEVDDHEVVPANGDRFYCYLRGEGSPAARALFDNFTRGGLLTEPPICCNDDGSSTFTLLGTAAEVQTAVEQVPDEAVVAVESVGGRDVAPGAVLSRLSDRQLAALEAANDLGYYDEPRGATTEDVAAALNCSVGTAAAHLRKAESKLVDGLLSR